MTPPPFLQLPNKTELEQRDEPPHRKLQAAITASGGNFLKFTEADARVAIELIESLRSPEATV